MQSPDRAQGSDINRSEDKVHHLSWKKVLSPVPTMGSEPLSVLFIATKVKSWKISPKASSSTVAPLENREGQRWPCIGTRSTSSSQ